MVSLRSKKKNFVSHLVGTGRQVNTGEQRASAGYVSMEANVTFAFLLRTSEAEQLTLSPTTEAGKIKLIHLIIIRRYEISKNNVRDVRSKANPINNEITARELRVIDSNGEQAGIMLLETALSLAERQDLDLVLISPNADPPVAKVMDFGKYRYDQQKREKEAKKKQKIIEVKEIRLSTFIEQHDLEIKGTMAKKFLAEGDKLKVSLRFKGRERGRTDRGFEVMQRFSEIIKEYGTPEKMPVLEGRSLIMIVNPLPPKKEKAAEKPAEKTADKTADKPAEAAKADRAAEKPAKAAKAKSDPAGQAEPEKKQKKVKGPSEELDI